MINWDPSMSLPWDNEPDEPVTYHCKKCGSFLRHKEDDIESFKIENEYEDYDGHMVQEIEYYTEVRRDCKKCGARNIEVVE